MRSPRPDYSYYRIITREAQFISPDFSCVREQNWPSGEENTTKSSEASEVSEVSVGGDRKRGASCGASCGVALAVALAGMCWSPPVVFAKPVKYAFGNEVNEVYKMKFASS